MRLTGRGFRAGFPGRSENKLLFRNVTIVASDDPKKFFMLALLYATSCTTDKKLEDVP